MGQNEVLPNFIRQLGRLDEVYRRCLDRAAAMEAKMMAGCATLVVGMINLSMSWSAASRMDALHEMQNATMLHMHVPPGLNMNWTRELPLPGILPKMRKK